MLGVKLGGVLSKAASSEGATTDKAGSSKANEDMWMKQLGRHGQEAAAREKRAEEEEEDKGDDIVVEGEEEEEEKGAAENEVGTFICIWEPSGSWTVLTQFQLLMYLHFN